MLALKSRRLLEPGQRARVLVVDDSLVIRRLVTLALEDEPGLQVVGTASNGKEALERLASLAPDVVTLDIEMPEMDGLEALRHIRQISPQVRVVMLSTLTERGASATLEALTLGADDYVAKLSAGKSLDDSTAKLRHELVPKLKQFFTFGSKDTAAFAFGPSNLAHERKAIVPQLPSLAVSPRILVIGVSTGGPTALASVLPAIPRDFGLPVLVVQHMPPLFTKLLCERLYERSSIPVREAVHGQIVEAGVALIAPGDFHMRVKLTAGEARPRISLDQSPPQNSCRPAVDPLFESVAELYGGAALAAILTGMGRDGLRGARLLKKAGATILAQDEETSAVWGMPRAVVEAHLADAVLPIQEIVPQILRYCDCAASRFEPRLQETF